MEIQSEPESRDFRVRVKLGYTSLVKTYYVAFKSPFNLDFI